MSLVALLSQACVDAETYFAALMHVAYAHLAESRDATQRINFAALLVVGKRYFEKAGSTRLGSESHRHAFGRPYDTIWQ